MKGKREQWEVIIPFHCLCPEKSDYDSLPSLTVG